ncbi:MAG: hypothetical protein ACRDSL_20880 [Pseudonocardiaceae bacterium]
MSSLPLSGTGRWANTIAPSWVAAPSRCGRVWPPAAAPRTLVPSKATPARRCPSRTRLASDADLHPQGGQSVQVGGIDPG